MILTFTEAELKDLIETDYDSLIQDMMDVVKSIDSLVDYDDIIQDMIYE